MPQLINSEAVSRKKKKTKSLSAIEFTKFGAKEKIKFKNPLGRQKIRQSSTVKAFVVVLFCPERFFVDERIQARKV